MKIALYTIISFHVSGDFCRLLITFANSLDPDQEQQNVGPDLDPNHQDDDYHCQPYWLL